MQRMMHETRETIASVLIASCLAVGVGAAAFYAAGPGGWLTRMVQRILQDPSLGALFAPIAVVGLVLAGKRYLDDHPRSIFNSLLVGALGLLGLVIILQGLMELLA